MHVGPQHLPQRGVQQMGGGVELRRLGCIVGQPALELVLRAAARDLAVRLVALREAGLVHGQPVLLRHLDRERQGEAVGLEQVERFRAGERVATLLPHPLGHLVVAPDPALECGPELRLLGADLGRDALAALFQLGVFLGEGGDHALRQLGAEAAGDAQRQPVADRPADQPAHHVAGVHVRGRCPVADGEDRRAQVVGDHPERFGAVAIAVPDSCSMRSISGRSVSMRKTSS